MRGSILIAILALVMAGPVLADPAGRAQVIDGDSLRVGSVEVRLWGIDAPEWHEPGGAQATAYLRSLVRGQDVNCETRDTDRYGRTVAQCFVGSMDIARALVQSGHARDWPRYSGGYYAQ